MLWDDLGTPEDILKGNLLLLIARAGDHVAIVAIERAERVAKGGKVDKVVLVLGLALVASVKVRQPREPERKERVRGEQEEAEGRVDQEWGDERGGENDGLLVGIRSWSRTRTQSQFRRPGHNQNTYSALELENAAHKCRREVLVGAFGESAQACPCVHCSSVLSSL